MTTDRFTALRRGIAAAVFALGLAAHAVAGAAADGRTFDVSGTVISIQGSTLVLLTSDVVGRAQPITVDVSALRGLQVRAGDPIALTVRSRESDSYLALGVQGESPFVNGEDFGVEEAFTTKQDSIAARVGNVPEDDEALAKQRKRDDHDDDDQERRRK